MLDDEEQPQSLADIKRSLFQRGLTDHQLLSRAVLQKKPSEVENKRRSRSFGDIVDIAHEQPKEIKRNASFRFQKPVSLHQQKRDLLVEIKARLEQRTQQEEHEEKLENQEKIEDGKEATNVTSPTSPEIRKRYSPVYTRTRSICRTSDTSSTYSSSWRNSVKEMQVPQSTPEQAPAGETAVVKRESNPARKSVKSLYSPSEFPHLAGFQFDVIKRNSSVPKLSPPQRNTYSAHPSLYFIEIDDGSDTSDMEKSTSNAKIKRHQSLRQTIKKKLQKTFSQHTVPATLENVPKAPGTKIPKFVVSCIGTLTKQDLLKTEGIYRSSPSQMDIRRVTKETQKGNFDILEKLSEPALLAGLLKNFFFTLKEHLISEETFERHFPIDKNESLIEEDFLDRLKILILDLDDIAFDTLSYLMKHLREVADLSDRNLMKSSNLGLVFAPCLFTNCEKKSSTIDLLNCMGLQAKVTELMIDNFEELFGAEAPRFAEAQSIVVSPQKRTPNAAGKKVKRERSKTVCVLS
ncbi:rho GTPase-activating protein 21-like [Phlebotomus argentipes]|uniref:rho GTPase-activating protein 21-like n=1 Tax=Phlebotomus argentipes TaxID=94469 RepID=UPI0028937A25|nr:rho GTPase-activating protein 21-like [Phlebotomus argentipes]XP_059612502.1 rho GTPase-activating protein 21-like [Phlebotomus argentipes]XP_059612503.1 rho GTPase-activating protein 21-like [Phlebotomus argentipes]XP_059612504.1 rho GTPase-activating protein 21-like [Phlebotomus argentipes]